MILFHVERLAKQRLVTAFQEMMQCVSRGTKTIRQCQLGGGWLTPISEIGLNTTLR